MIIDWVLFLNIKNLILKILRYCPISPAFVANEPKWPRKCCPCSQKDEEDSDSEEISPIDIEASKL